MAIQNSPGAVSSMDNFLDDLMTFAAANAGFTRLSDDTSGAETLYRLSRAGDATTYWAFRAREVTSSTGIQYGQHRVEARMMVAEPTYATFIDDTDYGQEYSTNMTAYGYPPNFTGYTFYSDGTNVFAILEIRQNVFNMIMFGNITKHTVFQGGEFLCSFTNARGTGSLTSPYEPLPTTASEAAAVPFGVMGYIIEPSVNYTGGGINALRISTTGGAVAQFGINGFTRITDVNNVNYWAGTAPPRHARSITASILGNDMFASLFEAGEGEGTLRIPLLPIYIKRIQPDIAGTCYIAGSVDNIRIVNMSSFAPRDLTLTDWRVYPYCAKDGDNFNHPISGNFGFAFKEIP